MPARSSSPQQIVAPGHFPRWGRETLRVVRELHKRSDEVVRIGWYSACLSDRRKEDFLKMRLIGLNELSFANTEVIPAIYSAHHYLLKGGVGHCHWLVRLRNLQLD
jgi:hypothetical protein